MAQRKSSFHSGNNRASSKTAPPTPVARSVSIYGGAPGAPAAEPPRMAQPIPVVAAQAARFPVLNGVAPSAVAQPRPVQAPVPFKRPCSHLRKHIDDLLNFAERDRPEEVYHEFLNRIQAVWKAAFSSKSPPETRFVFPAGATHQQQQQSLGSAAPLRRPGTPAFHYAAAPRSAPPPPPPGGGATLRVPTSAPVDVPGPLVLNGTVELPNGHVPVAQGVVPRKSQSKLGCYPDMNAVGEEEEAPPEISEQSRSLIRAAHDERPGLQIFEYRPEPPPGVLDEYPVDSRLVADMHRRADDWKQMLTGPVREGIPKTLPPLEVNALRMLEMSFVGQDPHLGHGMLMCDAFGDQYQAAVLASSCFTLKERRAEKALIIVGEDEVAIWRQAALEHVPTAVSLAIVDTAFLASLGPGGFVPTLEEWHGVMIVSRPALLDIVRHKESHDIVARELVKPGPDLVFVTEAHGMRFFDPAIHDALWSMTTRRRVAITAAPLANNLMEYWTMMDWAIPTYMGNADEFADCYVRPIADSCQVQVAGPDRMVARRVAGLLANRIKAVAFPASRPPHLKIAQHFVVRVHMDPDQANIYRLVQARLGVCARRNVIKPGLVAYLLQIAASHVHALRSVLMFIDKLGDAGLSHPDPVMEQIEDAVPVCRSILKEIYPKLHIQGEDIKRAEPNAFPSSKLEVIHALFLNCVKQQGSMLLVCASPDVCLSMYRCLLLRFDPEFVLLCEHFGDEKHWRKAVESWDGCKANQIPVVVCMAMGVTPDNVAKFGCSFADPTCIVMVDTTWSNQMDAQVHMRVHSSGTQQCPPVVFSLVTEATCESKWDSQHEATVCAGSILFDTYKFRAGFLVDVNDDSEVLTTSRYPEFWDYRAKPMAHAVLKKSDGIGSDVVEFDKGVGGGKLLDLVGVRLLGKYDTFFAVSSVSVPVVSRFELAANHLTRGVCTCLLGPHGELEKACAEHEFFLKNHRDTGGGTEEAARVERLGRAVVADLRKGLSDPSIMALYFFAKKYWDIHCRMYRSQQPDMSKIPSKVFGSPGGRASGGPPVRPPPSPYNARGPEGPLPPRPGSPFQGGDNRDRLPPPPPPNGDSRGPPEPFEIDGPRGRPPAPFENGDQRSRPPPPRENGDPRGRPPSPFENGEPRGRPPPPRENSDSRGRPPSPFNGPRDRPPPPRSPFRGGDRPMWPPNRDQRGGPHRHDQLDGPHGFDQRGPHRHDSRDRPPHFDSRDAPHFHRNRPEFGDGGPRDAPRRRDRADYENGGDSHDAPPRRRQRGDWREDGGPPDDRDYPRGDPGWHHRN